MCGRFTSSRRREALVERFEVAVPESYQERYNLAPQQRTLIIRERDEGREAVMAKWGLLPHWAKDAKVAREQPEPIPAYLTLQAKAGASAGKRPSAPEVRPRAPASLVAEWWKDDKGLERGRERAEDQLREVLCRVCRRCQAESG